MLLAGTWTNLAPSAGSAPPDGGAMMLLSDGSILVQDGINPDDRPAPSSCRRRRTPASYVNGAWSGGGTMNEARLFFATAMMPNGKVFAVGGEYPKFSNTAEIYNSTTNSWSYVDSAPTLSTNVDLYGTVTGASNSNPITITTASTQPLQNGIQVTIAGVSGNTAANGTFTVSNVTARASSNSDGTTGDSSTMARGGSGTPTRPSSATTPSRCCPAANNGQVLAGYFFD